LKIGYGEETSDTHLSSTILKLRTFTKYITLIKDANGKMILIYSQKLEREGCGRGGKDIGNTHRIN
jgi:hypothetical protein